MLKEDLHGSCIYVSAGRLPVSPRPFPFHDSTRVALSELLCDIQWEGKGVSYVVSFSVCFY